MKNNIFIFIRCEMSIEEEILRLKAHMEEQEIADDGYYLSRQYKEDCHQLYLLKSSLKKSLKISYK